MTAVGKSLAELGEVAKAADERKGYLKPLKRS